MYDERQINPLNATAETTRVVASNYVCMAITIVVLATRAGLNLKWKRKLGLDDLLLYLALAACIIESVLTENAVKRGLGTFIRPGNSSKLQRLSELVYASDLVYLIAMFMAKASVVRTVYRFASRAAISKAKLLYLQIFIVVWAAFSFPAIAFQCGIPLPWLYLPQRCVGSGALWYPVLMLSILTDVWLSVCAFTSLPELQVTQKQRQVITGLFASRILTCLLTIVQLALLAPALKNINQPRAMPNPTVLKQFVMNASIITAALPLLSRPLAQHQPISSAQAAVYTTEDRTPTTPLEELKAPVATTLPDPVRFDGLFKEMSVRDPSARSSSSDSESERNDFSFGFSSQFDKEVGVTVSKV